MNEDFEKIVFEGKTYFIIGCEMCQKNEWIIATDGEVFICHCRNCGHRIKLQQESLRDKPKYQVFDARFFT